MIVIFTDLDGTLLDKNYSFQKAKSALKLIKNKKVPLIFCTSKTRAESILYQKKLAIKCPFIIENGGAIFIPKNYFNFKFKYDKKIDGFYVMELGTQNKKLLKELEEIEKKTNTKIISFNKMSPKQVANDCKLPLKEAKLAKKREYVEPFKVIKGDEKKVIKEIKKRKLNHTQSIRYNYIMGNNDKGKAVKILAKLFKRKYKKVNSIALGDSLNDLPMLKAVDKPFLVKNYHGVHNKSIKKIKKIVKVNGKGPEGWNKAVLSLLNA
jgi:mannosyl-3-phosphoglycerate phosphatase